MNSTKFVALATLSTLLSISANAALTLTPGTVVVSSELSGMLRQLDPLTGSTLSSVQLRTPSGANIASVVAMTLVNQQLYVSDGFSTGRVNPETGIVTHVFGNFSSGLGNRDGLLLTQGNQSIGIFSLDGVLLSDVECDGQSAGVPPEVGYRFRDVDWTGQRYGMLEDPHGDTQPTYFEVFEFNEQGAYITNTVQYFRPPTYNPNGFDIDLATNQFWIALDRFDSFNSQVRLYDRSNPTALRSLTLPYGGLTDVVYIPIPTPGASSLALASVALAATRRRRKLP